MGGFALVLWAGVLTIGGLFMVFVEVDEDSPFYIIKSLGLTEKAKMEIVGRQVEDFLQVHNNSKYISLALPSCGGLCNMFYRFLSVYGIGRDLGRLPFIDQKMRCFRDTMPEFKYALPNLYRAIKFIRPPKKKQVSFGNNCCKWDNSSKLERFSQHQYLYVQGNLLQAFGYFHQYKDEIRYLLTFSQPVQKEVNAFATKLFGNDNAHKLCVHTRLGDFKEHFLLESTHNFTDPALEFTARYLKEMYSDISLVFLGLDTDFMQTVPIPSDLFTGQYMPKSLNRTSDIYFASRYCDSLLMTASGSTFGWWIAYLMPENKQHNIFYNIDTSKRKDFGKNTYDYDSFLPEWKRLRLLKNGSIVFEPRWHYQIKDSK